MAANLAEIEAKGWFLNPGRYIGDHELEERISENVSKMLGGVVD